MHTSIELMELAKQRLALKHDLTLPVTDYRLGKLMGIRQATLSSWRSGRTHIGTEFVRKFADACELPEAYVYACVQSERESNPEVKSVLANIAKQYAPRVAGALGAVILSSGLLLASSTFPASRAEAAVITPSVKNIGDCRRRHRRRRYHRRRELLLRHAAIA